MLQQLIHSVRVNVFESARFYYWVLVVLTSYFLLNRFLQKLSFVYLDNRWTELKIGEGILFGLAYGFILISAWFLRRKIPRYVFWCWGGIVCVFLINELRFFWSEDNYNLIESFTKSQGLYTSTLTLPILFFGVWTTLKQKSQYGILFLTRLQVFLKINAVLIISGVIFNVYVFESYPLSGRWGYSGLLWHLSFHSIVYGVFLLFLIEQKKKEWVSILLFGLVLLLLGQKAGLLYFLLIFTLGLVTNSYLKGGIILGYLMMIFSAPIWLPHIISLIPFWENIYNKHGVWGVLLSLRNENIQKFYGEVGKELSYVDVMLGGLIRFPSRIEMMAFDFLVFFGVFGLFFICYFLLKTVPNWRWGIPFIVAFFGGGIYINPLGMLLFIIALEDINK